eukprot:scaffold1390_cov172-Amphora_coffeaeformis.AAC.7
MNNPQKILTRLAFELATDSAPTASTLPSALNDRDRPKNAPSCPELKALPLRIHDTVESSAIRCHVST